MGGRRSSARLLPTALLAVLVLFGGGPALAEEPIPPVPPTAATPTPPGAVRLPPGEAPDGRTVGGNELGTRGVLVAEGAPALPSDVVAPTWLVADAGSGEVLAARDPHGRYYPASTLKTLTLLALLPLLDPAEVVVGTRDDENIDGTRVGIVEGGRYPVQLLYEALMLASGNDAANALARAAGGQARTLEAMNGTAAALGAFDTVAGTPSGLDAPGQSSSVYDLALIFRALLDDPRAVAVLRTPTAQMPVVPNRSPGYQIQNKNPLLTRYPGNLGAKNGFTEAARHGFVTAAERGGRRIVVSLLGTEATPLRGPDQAARLLDWGFSVAAGSPGVGRLIEPAEAAALASPPTIPRHDDRTALPAAGATDVPAEPEPEPAPAPSAPPLPALVSGGLAVLLAAVVVGRRLIRRPVMVAAGDPGAAGRGGNPPEPEPEPEREPEPRPAQVSGGSAGPAPEADPETSTPGSTPGSPSTPP
jgi:D-alanyl-D-alanine carboxypeptidase (penicillin-binding protein 5/6)